MKVLKFTLGGDTAFFKKPDVNTYYYFTYGCIHKVALLGIFGSILGYGGYNQMSEKDDFPEFYERLKNIKISIVPGSKTGYFPKKIQSFNNSVGYASKEQGGNLIVKEQWLENPSWDIYLQIVDRESEKLSQTIQERRCTFIPYLGKNDHPADISYAVVLEGKEAEGKGYLDSIVPKDCVTLDLDEKEFEIDRPFKYEEYLPVSLNKITNLYETKDFVFSNFGILNASCDVIQVREENEQNTKRLVFF